MSHVSFDFDGKGRNFYDWIYGLMTTTSPGQCPILHEGYGVLFSYDSRSRSSAMRREMLKLSRILTVHGFGWSKGNWVHYLVMCGFMTLGYRIQRIMDDGSCGTRSGVPASRFGK